MLTLLACFHREGYIAYPALHSAVIAVEEAARNGVNCQIVAAIDRGDATTRECIRLFSDHLTAIHEVDFGDVSMARNYAIERIDSKYVATLDGDDCVDRDWLWKGVRFLEEDGTENLVAHPEVRLTFGNELHGRLQISSDGHLFHPLNLISSWHYAADLIIPTKLYIKLPMLPNHYESGLGGEDWQWTCESIAAGIRHAIVPGTCSYYRRQANHVSLGMLPSLTFSPTALLNKHKIEELNETFQSAAIQLAGSLDSAIGAKQSWSVVPQWVEESAHRACDLDFEFYTLYNKLAITHFESPDFFPAVGQLYLRLLAAISGENPCVIFVCDRLESHDLNLIDSFLAVHRQRAGTEVDILVVSLQRSADHLTATNDRSGPGFKHVDLGNDTGYIRLWERFKQDILVRFILQTRPKLVVNPGSTFFDRLSAEFGKAIASVGTQTVRICTGRVEGKDGVEALEGWWGLVRAECNYSRVLCEDSETASWLRAGFNGTGMYINSRTVSPGSSTAQAMTHTLYDLLDGCELHDRTPLTPFRKHVATHEPKITCIVTVCAEGYTLNATLRSVSLMCEYAQQKGLSSELIVVAHHAGKHTLKVLDKLPERWPGARTVVLEEPDSGKARNIGIEMARGSFIAMLHGNCMVSPSWLYQAVQLIEDQGPDLIAHPQAMVEFDDRLDTRYLPGMGQLELLASGEVWPEPALAQRELFVRNPYRSVPFRSGYGHPVWHWNCETVVAGARHDIVKQTTVYCRPAGFSGERNSTLGSISRVTLPPTQFFSDHQWLSELSEEAAVDRSSTPARWNEDTYLAENPDVLRAVGQGRVLTGYDHYNRHGRAEGRVACWQPEQATESVNTGIKRIARTLGNQPLIMKASWRLHSLYSTALRYKMQRLQAPPFPAWMKKETRLLSKFEPALKKAASGGAFTATQRRSPVAGCYRRCWEIMQQAQPSHIIMLSSLRPGGAELSAFHGMEAILSSADNRVLVITTEPGNDGWKNRLPDGCIWLPLGAMTKDCLVEERYEIMMRLLLNGPARCLHISYTWLGWHLLKRYASVLADRMQLYVSVFAIPLPGINEDSGYASFLPALIPYLTAVLTDNERTANQLCNVTGIPRRRVTVLKHPVAIEQRFEGPSQDRKVVLWASRLDREKRPDLLIQIAERLPDVEFHVYGESVLGNDDMAEQIQAVANIRFCGPFHGFDTIPSAPYALFLYTSSWDGLPNVLLEAMSSGLLVLASDVGGISEIVTKDTGILIHDFDQAGEYARMIRVVLENPDFYHDIARTGCQRIRQNFTRPAFLESLQTAAGYL